MMNILQIKVDFNADVTRTLEIMDQYNIKSSELHTLYTIYKEEQFSLKSIIECSQQFNMDSTSLMNRLDELFPKYKEEVGIRPRGNQLKKYQTDVLSILTEISKKHYDTGLETCIQLYTKSGLSKHHFTDLDASYDEKMMNDFDKTIDDIVENEI